MTLDESVTEMTGILFDEDLLRVVIRMVCGSIFFTADENERRCDQCCYELTPDKEAQLWRLLKR
jgi:hypothetical protein